MIYLINPVDLMTDAKKGCKIFCTTYCGAKCPLDFVQPLYGIPI